MNLLSARTRAAASLALFALVAACASAAGRVAPAASAPVAPVAPVAPAAAALPERLSDAEFWKLVSDISEPGGYFRIEDNYTSNEREVGQLFTTLREARVSGDVYLGVGPEQNFTYVASIRPRMAFIVDIRRQAVMQHLMYKAMFEMAKDRGEFVSLLFARKRPDNTDSAVTIAQIWNAFGIVPRDSALSATTYARLVDRLTKTHAFIFTDDEFRQLRRVYDAFQYLGPQITTRGSTMVGRGGGATFADLTGGSLDAAGHVQSFLSTEDNYRYVKSLHEKNLIVPVSGDFGGPKAIRAIGAYLRERGGVVRAFYVSNVEQYLFQSGAQMAFYGNVATLPVDSASVFIRPYSMRRGASGPGVPLCPVEAFLRGFAAGGVYAYNQVLACPVAPRIY